MGVPLSAIASNNRSAKSLAMESLLTHVCLRTAQRPTPCLQNRRAPAAINRRPKENFTNRTLICRTAIQAAKPIETGKSRSATEGAGAIRTFIVYDGRGGLYASYCRPFVGGVAWTSSRLLSQFPASWAVAVAAYLNDTCEDRLATRYGRCSLLARTACMPRLEPVLFFTSTKGVA